MAVDPKVLEELRKEPEVELDLSWLQPDSETGVRALPGKHGLTVENIQVGSYGQIPDTTRNFSMRPRGAAPRDGAQRLGIRWDEKTASWSDAASMLYEEAQQRQWSSATDIPWQELEPLPEDLELAMCQLCTFLTQVEFIAGDVPGRWLQHISADYYEVALFLATQVMDEGRHLDVFRKRALANGGGLLQAGPGAIGLLTAEDFTEMTATLHLVGEGFVQSVFRMGELIAKNEVDKRIFRLSAQDESRHVAFGVTHMKYVVETQPERREEIHGFLDRQEGLLGVGSTQAGLTGGGATGESLAILLGGGKDKLDEGYQTLLAIRRRQVNEYMQRLSVCGLGDRRERMAPGLRMFLDQPAA
jgi:hypothetical protein